MITIFTRKELLITMDVNRQSNIRGILAANGIKYTVKVTNLQSASVVGSSRARVGTFGINQNYSYEYKIYVHKKDYENALRLIR
jgi:c-di-GMP-binding flagellar brake protein YcgR